MDTIEMLDKMLEGATVLEQRAHRIRTLHYLLIKQNADRDMVSDAVEWMTHSDLTAEQIMALVNEE